MSPRVRAFSADLVNHAIAVRKADRSLSFREIGRSLAVAHADLNEFVRKAGERSKYLGLRWHSEDFGWPAELSVRAKAARIAEPGKPWSQIGRELEIPAGRLDAFCNWIARVCRQDKIRLERAPTVVARRRPEAAYEPAPMPAPAPVPLPAPPVAIRHPVLAVRHQPVPIEARGLVAWRERFDLPKDAPLAVVNAACVRRRLPPLMVVT